MSKHEHMQAVAQFHETDDGVRAGWEVEVGGGYYQGGFTIRHNDQATCERIALTWNAHDALLEALKFSCREAWWSEEEHMGGPPGDCPQRLGRILHVARAAIDKARRNDR